MARPPVREPRRMQVRPIGQERVATVQTEPEKPAYTERPTIATAPEAPARESVPQPTRGAAVRPAEERQSDTHPPGGPAGPDRDKEPSGAEASEATLSKDVTNLNKNIEKNDQDLDSQIKGLQGRTAVLEQDNAALTASVDELQGNANYTSTGGGGVGGLLGFSTTTWIVIAVAVGVGIYFWNRSRSAQVEQVQPVAAAPPPPGAY